MASAPLVEAGERARVAEWPPTLEAQDPDEDATLGSRLMAAVIDILILLTVDVIVIYFTMQICGISAAETRLCCRKGRSSRF